VLLHCRDLVFDSYILLVHELASYNTKIRISPQLKLHDLAIYTFLVLGSASCIIKNNDFRNQISSTLTQNFTHCLAIHYFKRKA
jgi:hypothetical protein